MKVQTILSPTSQARREDFEKLSVAEERVVWQHYTQGRLRELYFQADPIRVVLVWETADLSQVPDLMNTFPMIRAGLFQVETIVLGPWVPILALFRDDVKAEAGRS
ncbi:MAG: hypothetical protein SFV54_19310 [Bryobacteraceae bacterium]|nr:hypothetical protein [Bryobacteraceae bacterium]